MTWIYGFTEHLPVGNDRLGRLVITRLSRLFGLARYLFSETINTSCGPINTTMHYFGEAMMRADTQHLGEATATGIEEALIARLQLPLYGCHTRAHPSESPRPRHSSIMFVP